MNKHISVYIVEDYSITRAALCSVVQNAGFELAGSSATAEKALADLNARVPDVFILDYNLKGSKNGVWLAKKLRDEFPQVKIIFLTAMGNDRVLSLIREAGPDAYLMKPFNKPTLITAIELACAREADSTEEAKKSKSGSRVFLKQGRESFKVPFNDILYLHSDKNYLLIHTSKRLFRYRMKLAESFDSFKLPSYFVQCHRRYVVNSNLIDSFSATELKIQDRTIPLSQSFKSRLSEILL
ncbi:MAG: response regulator transcription factor [Nonlabens sp.]